jgi:hypothetical protein
MLSLLFKSELTSLNTTEGLEQFAAIDKEIFENVDLENLDRIEDNLLFMMNKGLKRIKEDFINLKELFMRIHQL